MYSYSRGVSELAWARMEMHTSKVGGVVGEQWSLVS